MEVIRGQLVFLCGSFLSGMAVMLAYECVNVLRGLFRLRTLGKLLLDLFFFSVSSFMVFQMIFLCNDGMLRGFFVFAFGTGAVMYRKTFGTSLSAWILRTIRWIIRQVLRPVRWFQEKKQKKP